MQSLWWMDNFLVYKLLSWTLVIKHFGCTCKLYTVVFDAVGLVVKADCEKAKLECIKWSFSKSPLSCFQVVFDREQKGLCYGKQVGTTFLRQWKPLYVVVLNFDKSWRPHQVYYDDFFSHLSFLQTCWCFGVMFSETWSEGEFFFLNWNDGASLLQNPYKSLKIMFQIN